MAKSSKRRGKRLAKMRFGKQSKRSQSARERSPRFSTQTEREKSSHERSFALLSDLRRRKGTYTELLGKHHLDTRTAHRHLGRDLIGGTAGRPVRASKADRRLREVMFPKSFGDVPIRTRNSRDATKLSEFFRDRDKLLRGKLSAKSFEAKWRGKRIAGQEVFADATTIFLRQDFGDLKIESLYARWEVRNDWAHCQYCPSPLPPAGTSSAKSVSPVYSG